MAIYDNLSEPDKRLVSIRVEQLLKMLDYSLRPADAPSLSASTANIVRMEWREMLSSPDELAKLRAAASKQGGHADRVSENRGGGAAPQF